MPTISSIPLPDAQATPVQHQFVPVGQDANGTWWFDDQSSSTAGLGFNRLSVSFSRPGNPAPGASSANRLYRVRYGVHTPKLEVLAASAGGVTPAPQIAYIPRFNGEFIIPERSSAQDRADLRQYAGNVMFNPKFVEMVEGLANFY